jgi:hypothetical protein
MGNIISAGVTYVNTYTKSLRNGTLNVPCTSTAHTCNVCPYIIQPAIVSTFPYYTPKVVLYQTQQNTIQVCLTFTGYHKHAVHAVHCYVYNSCYKKKYVAVTDSNLNEAYTFKILYYNLA